MKRLKYLFLMLCLVMGITGCGSRGQEYIDWDALQEEIGKHINTETIKDFVYNDLLEKYGLRYDMCFSWSLTTYRI